MRRGIAAAMAGRLQGSGPCWLAASGTRYMLYPGEFVPQPVGRVKRFSTFALNSTARTQHMSRKNRRSQLRKPQRGSSGAGRATRPAGMPPAAASQPNQPGQPAPASSSATASPAALPRPLPAEDAAIPLERVPYFRSDLRRIAITAGLMFVLLIAGSIVLRSLLQA